MRRSLLQTLAILMFVAWAWTDRAATKTEPVTFAGQIAPLIYANCSACHREGETAPFSMMNYAEIRKHAKQIADVTTRRIMPPWRAQHGQGDFLGERQLSEDQIALIQQWVSQDCPEGDPAAAPKPPQFPAGWQLGEPDLIVKMAEPYTLAATGRDDYQCFVIPITVPAGKYIRAVEYRPGNRKVVHHALLTSLKHDFAVMKLILGNNNGKSFSSGLVAPGERLAGPLGIWTPGWESQPLPEGFAAAWPAGCDLVLQLHLHPSGKPETEQSSVGFYFTDQKPRGKLRSMVMLDKDVNIAPGDAHYATHKSFVLKEAADAYGLFPHMHLLGRTVRVTATFPDGSTRAMLSINDWDFNWQNYYQYATPLRLPAGTRLDADWTFDNSAANPANPSQPPRRVTFGEQTTNEMAALILDVIPAKANAPKAP